MTRDDPTVRDWCAVNITLERGCSGAKPDHFCSWLFAVLGCKKGDQLDDLFPGSNAVGRAWDDFNGRLL